MTRHLHKTTQKWRAAALIGLSAGVIGCSATWRKEPEPPPTPARADPLAPLPAPTTAVDEARLAPMQGVEERRDFERPSRSSVPSYDTSIDGVIDPVTGAFSPNIVRSRRAGEYPEDVFDPVAAYDPDATYDPDAAYDPSREDEDGESDD